MRVSEAAGCGQHPAQHLDPVKGTDHDRARGVSLTAKRTFGKSALISRVKGTCQSAHWDVRKLLFFSDMPWQRSRGFVLEVKRT